MSIRTKFKCFQVVKNADSDKTSLVRMNAVYQGSEENKEFWKLTPSGYLDLQLVNDLGLEQGKEYYIDITEAGK